MNLVSVVILLSVAMATAWFLLPFCYRKFAERRLARICAERRTIVLSYDDGPGKELTPELIELLHREQVAATFFVLGRRAAKHAQLVSRMLSHGHEVGSHTYEHRNAWKSLPVAMSRDVRRGDEIVTALGACAGLFRPPFGKLTMAGLLEGFLKGMRFAWWTVDSRDSWRRREVEDVLNEIERKGGGVVLMHDFDTYERAERADGASHADFVLDLTSKIIEFARARNFRLATYGELFV